MYKPDETLQQLMQSLTDEPDKIGILLAVQMGGTPQELQLLIQTANFTEETHTVQSEEAFLLRCVGVGEHRVSLGMFKQMMLVDDDPLLWNHNTPYVQVYFRGQTEQIDTLMLELTQLYGQHYSVFRSLADDINRMAPLSTILSGGYGLLGEMPTPMAERVKTLFERNGLTITFQPSERETPTIPSRLLVLDDSFFIAQLFSADPVKGKA
jgi:hypothetical protein